MLLHGDLQDADIPHRTTMRSRILERGVEHLESMSDSMLVRSLVPFL
jgi:hypothetical protein